MHEPQKILTLQLRQRIKGEAHGKAAKEDPLTDVAGLRPFGSESWVLDKILQCIKAHESTWKMSRIIISDVQNRNNIFWMQGLPREVVGRTPSHIWGACPWFPTAQDRKCHGNHSNIIATYSIPTPKCNSPLSGCFYGVVDYCNLKAVRYQKSRIGNVSSDPPRQGPDQRILHVVTMMMRQQIVTYIFPAPPPFFGTWPHLTRHTMSFPSVGLILNLTRSKPSSPHCWEARAARTKQGQSKSFNIFKVPRES